MVLKAVIDQLLGSLSAQARVLTNPDSEEFHQLILRWSDINRRIPGAIVVAGEEADVVETVKAAIENNVPFVPCSGGHSLWSTIGSEGFILDLRQLRNISFDRKSRQITLQSGILVKQANDTAWEHGLCLPLGTANTAGVIPLALGGGLSTLSSLTGSTSDNIVSAKIVTADGRLINASATSHPDLFYGLRGAGQCFGVVTEVTIQAYPISILGTPDGSVWTGIMVFPMIVADRVFEVLSSLTQDTTAPTMGMCIITSPPPSFATSLIVIPVFFGDAVDAESFYQPLIALGPFLTCKNVAYPRINDSGDAFGVKGGFKRFSGAGLQRLNTKTWMQVAARYEELKSSVPDASTSGYGMEWNMRGTRHVGDDTAFSHHEVKIWAEFLSWYSDPASHSVVSLAEQEVMALVRQDQDHEEYISYQNWTRDEPIEHLYVGAARREKLRILKQKWDPTGVFTHLFLA